MKNVKQTHTERQSTKEVVSTLKCGCYERQNKIAELFLVKTFQRNGKSLLRNTKKICCEELKGNLDMF